jgi:hypothetical protein
MKHIKLSSNDFIENKIFEKKEKFKTLSKLLEPSETYEIYFKQDNGKCVFFMECPDIYTCVQYFDAHKKGNNLIMIKSMNNRVLVDDDEIDLYRNVDKYNL